MSNLKLAVSVVVAMAVYVFAGGAIFQRLDYDDNDRKDASKRRYDVEEFVNEFFNGSIDCINQSDFRSVLDRLMAIDGKLSVGANVEDVPSCWDYYTAVFFAVTALTTIGYGNVAPRSMPGQAFCIFYSVIGVPLCFLTMAVVGEQECNLANWICRMLRCTGSSKRMRLIQSLLGIVVGFVIFFKLPAIIFSVVENWTYHESLYYAYVTLLTIGFGDFVPASSFVYESFPLKAAYRFMIALWILFGCSFCCSVYVSTCQDVYKMTFEYVLKVTSQSMTRVVSGWKLFLHRRDNPESTGTNGVASGPEVASPRSNNSATNGGFELNEYLPVEMNGVYPVLNQRVVDAGRDMCYPNDPVRNGSVNLR